MQPKYTAATPLMRYTCPNCAANTRVFMVRYGMVNVDLYSAIITKVSNALDTLVAATTVFLHKL